MIDFEVPELKKIENITGLNILELLYLAFDLLTLMLKADPLERISANDALLHPYFNYFTMTTSSSLTPLYISLKRLIFLMN